MVKADQLLVTPNLRRRRNSQPTTLNRRLLVTPEPCAKAEVSHQGGSTLLNLLGYHFDLLVDHLAGEPVDGHMDPVMLFPFHDELGKIRGLWILS